MIKNKVRDRSVQVIILFSIIFLILLFRLADLTVVNGEIYHEKSINNRLKKITEVAQRGEIRDRNGKLLAGNIPAFTVQLINGDLPKQEFNNVAIKIFDILDKKNEKHIEFPIAITDNGDFKFTYDLEIEKWLTDNGYSGLMDAQEVFDQIRTREMISDELDKYEAQRFLLYKGIRLPISVRNMQFLPEIEKNNFLDLYRLDKDISAKEAFKYIRDKTYSLNPELPDEDAYKIMTLKYAIAKKGYKKYEPIKIANNIDKSTALLIEEMGMELSGIDIGIEPIRYYPYKNQAAHILGYMGKISSQSEIDKYIKDNNYNQNQIIGKVGIEGHYELELTGDNGANYVIVDALGNYIRDASKQYENVESSDSVAGKNIQLTIDIDLQQNLYNYLEKALKAIQVGGTYESKWGDYNYKDTFDKAQSGAAIVVDVNTGEVLAMANYPSYDLNLFSTGISSKNWDKLRPTNIRNPLAPRPLYNIATLTAVQPGSTYKMITGYAGMEEGLDPTRKLYSDGHVDIGNQTYGCWYWNDYGLRHGPTDLYHALEVSCNYYFFNVSTGKDYHKGTSLGFDMDTEKLTNYSKRFGLDEATGIEISESVRGVPNPKKKRENVKWFMKRKLKDILLDYFPQDELIDDDKTDEIIREIISWNEENPSRGTIISRLTELGAGPEYSTIAALADIIKYDYFNLMEWQEGDSLNLAIGQGKHEYTTVQMARYIAAVANDGYLNELSLVKKVANESVNKNQGITNYELNSNDNLKHLRKGMYEVVNGDRGTSRTAFYDFPVKIAAKTGTAEKEGKIPPISEVEYIKENLSKIDPNLSFDEVDKKTEELLISRNKELATLERKKDALETQEEKDEVQSKIIRLISDGYINRDMVMREAIKLLSNKKIDDTAINEYRSDYDSFGWFVSFAPFEDPEIAVVVFITQGGHGSYGAPVARDIIADYLKLEDPTNEESAGESQE